MFVFKFQGAVWHNVVELTIEGSILSGGDIPVVVNGTALQYDKVFDGYQSAALKTRLAIPMIFGIDAVHGHNTFGGATIYPHNIGLGCTRLSSYIIAMLLPRDGTCPLSKAHVTKSLLALLLMHWWFVNWKRECIERNYRIETIWNRKWFTLSNVDVFKTT